MSSDWIAIRKGEGISKIAEVIYSPYPRRSWVNYQDEVEGLTLLHILKLLGADAQVDVPATDGSQARWSFRIRNFLTPELLAEAIGISQA